MGKYNLREEIFVIFFFLIYDYEQYFVFANNTHQGNPLFTYRPYQYHD